MVTFPTLPVTQKKGRITEIKICPNEHFYAKKKRFSTNLHEFFNAEIDIRIKLFITISEYLII